MQMAARQSFPAIDLQADPYAAAVADETSIRTLDSAVAALAVVKEGMSQVSTDRAKVGAAQASLEAESERLTGRAYVADLRRQPDH